MCENGIDRKHGKLANAKKNNSTSFQPPGKIASGQKPQDNPHQINAEHRQLLCRFRRNWLRVPGLHTFDDPDFAAQRRS